MLINLIVANSENGTIGKNGEIPWNIPNDLKRFRKLTIGSIVIMGRKTYESIGKSLDNRYNFVLSSNKINDENIYCFNNIESALKYAEKEVKDYNIFVIGGASIYKQFLEMGIVDKIYQTIVKKSIDGDTFFTFDKNYWKIIENEESAECKYLTWEKK